MKVIIPPPIRRIMQSYPPVEPIGISPPVPPLPPETIDIVKVCLQLLGVFVTTWLILQIAKLFYNSSISLANLIRNIAVIFLVIGLLVIALRALFILRQQIRPSSKHENEYLQALAIYAQAEKNHYDRVAKEHTPEKIRSYRQQELDILIKKLPAFNFELSDPDNHPLPPVFQYFRELGHTFYQPLINIPGIEKGYMPDFIVQNENKTITIVVDQEDKMTDEYLVREFFSQRGIIWIILENNEIEELKTEINQIWQRIGL